MESRKPPTVPLTLAGECPVVRAPVSELLQWTSKSLETHNLTHIALAVECPVVRISVVRISAVDTQVTQLPIISNILAQKAIPVSVELLAVPASIAKLKRNPPPKM